MYNGEPKEKKSSYPVTKPITTSTKQVVQGNGRKTWKNIKPTRRGLSEQRQLEKMGFVLLVSTVLHILIHVYTHINDSKSVLLYFQIL
jgi:hypothetical protein